MSIKWFFSRALAPLGHHAPLLSRHASTRACSPPRASWCCPKGPQVCIPPGGEIHHSPHPQHPQHGRWRRLSASQGLPRGRIAASRPRWRPRRRLPRRTRARAPSATFLPSTRATTSTTTGPGDLAPLRHRLQHGLQQQVMRPRARPRGQRRPRGRRAGRSRPTRAGQDPAPVSLNST